MNKFLLTLIAIFVAAGCTLNAGAPAPGDETRAWFDSPLPGTLYTPPSPICPIIAHGASPAGIAVFELTINGSAELLPSQNTQGTLSTLSKNCDLSEPGVYELQVRVQDNAGNWSGYAETSLVIVAAITDTPGTGTPSPIPPTPSATPSPLGAVTVESISTDIIYVGDSSCGPTQVTIVARATAPKGIKVVVFFYRFEPGSAPGFQSIAMDPIGGDLYELTLSPTSILNGVMTADQATLQYQIVVQQNDGDTTVRTPVLADIGLLPCGNAVLNCSSFTSKSSCESHGCVWFSTAGTATPGAVNECQIP